MLPSNITQRIATFLAGKKIVLLGFGKEGQSTLKFLHKHKLVKKVAIADRRGEADLKPIVNEIGIEKIAIQFHSGTDYLSKLGDYDLILKSPGIFDFARLDSNIKNRLEAKVTSQTDLLLRFADFTTIGITGTKGKSTTSKLLFEILKEDGRTAHLLGNIGAPSFDSLETFLTDSIAVLELSSYQTEYLTRGPKFAVILNLYEEHLDFHGSVEAYHRAKWNLTLTQNEKDHLIFHGQNRYIQELLKSPSTRAKTHPFTQEDVQKFEKELRFSVLAAEHNRWNLSAAMAVCKLIGVDPKAIASTILHFEPLPHRLQLVATIEGISYYDDSISTTVESTLAALEAIPNVQTLLLGGQDRGINYQPLVEAIISDKRIKNVVLFPESGNRLFTELREQNRINILRTDEMAEAVRFSKLNTAKGKAVVLSPAAPSYNKYQNYIERGEDYAKYVNKL